MSAADNDDDLSPAVVGWWVDTAAPALSLERKEKVWARILKRINVPGPEGTLTIRAGEGAWIPCGPGLEVKILYVDEQQGAQTALWRMQPGSMLPAHAHRIDEECLVLEGEIRAGDFVVRQGDFHVGFAKQSHSDIYSDNGALLLIRSERRYLAGAGQ